MISNFHIARPEVEEVLSHFYNATGLRVGIYTPNNELLIEYPIQPKVVFDRSFCDIMRAHSSTLRYQCANCDRQSIDEVCRTKKIRIYKCHMGFTEAVIPIISYGEVIAVMMIGQVHTEHPKEYEFYRVLAAVKDIDFNSLPQRTVNIFKDAFLHIKYVDIKQFNAYVSILEILASHLCSKHWLVSDKGTIIDNFIEWAEQNVYNDVTIAEAASALNVSKSHLSRVIRANKETNFSNYMLNLKVEEAKKMLTSSTMSIKEISVVLRFKEDTYFMRVFKAKTGYTCTEFRKRFTH